MKVSYNITQNKFNASLNQEVTEIKLQFQNGYYPLPVGLENYYTKNETDLLLENYYLKTETYSQNEVDSLFLNETLDTITDRGNNTENPITVGGVQSDFVQLDTTAINTYNVGKVYWNADKGTYNFGLKNNVELQLGQEQNVYGKAYSAITNGQLVMYRTSQGGHILFEPANFTQLSANPDLIIGVATQDIALNEFGYITTFGEVNTLNTSSFSDGNTLYFGSGNVLQNTIPSGSYFIVGRVNRSHATQGSIFVKPYFVDGNLESKSNKSDSYTASSSTTYASTKALVDGLATKADLVDGKVPSSQLPSYVDDVLEFANLASFPATGESGKIYIAIDTNVTYRWTGTGYAEISASLALGETSSTAYRGDRGKIAYDHSQTIGNPHGTTKAQVGLGNVDNTSDLDKPISILTQLALDNKVNKNPEIVSSTKTKVTYDSKGLVIAGDDATTIDINDSIDRRYVTDVQLNTIQNTSGINTGDETMLSIQTKRPLKTIKGESLEGVGNIDLTKNDVGLSNVDNTSDINKPISTATQTALDLKVDKVAGKQLSTEDYTTSEKNKLAGIQSGAEVNVNADWNAISGDAYILNKPSTFTPSAHTHPISQIDNLQTTIDAKADLVNGLVPASQLPSFVNDVLEFSTIVDFPTNGETDKIYLAKDTNKIYRWSGSEYVQVNGGLALGETSETAYRGDRGKIAYDHSQTIGNPHNTTKSDIGLGNVDNTSDLNKPISTATQTALNSKQDNLGYTPENEANKSDSYTSSSSTTYASTKALVDGLATKLDKGTYNGTAQDLKNSIDGIEIGGRNYARNGNYKDTSFLNIYSNINTITAQNNELRVTGGNNGYYYHYGFPAIALDETITISFWVKNNTSNPNNVSPTLNGNGGFGSITLTPNQGWTKYEKTGVIGSATSNPLSSILFENYNSGSFDISIKELMVEKGNKATDWSPAPEDKQDRLQDITGNIGLGKSDTIATEKLDVNGYVKATGFKTPSGTSSQYLMADGSVSTLTNPITGTGTTNYLPKFTASGTIGNSLIYDNGTNVGIGTTAPNINSYTRALTILASSGYAGMEVYGGSTTTGGQIDFGGGTDRFASISGEYESATNGFLNIRTRRAGSMVNAMRITSDGKVGIGTTSPSARLNVSGSGIGAAIDWTNTLANRTFRWVSLDSGGFAIEDITASAERMRITSGGSLLVGSNIAPYEPVWRGAAVFGINGATKVIIGNINSGYTGATIGGHNSALDGWADLNIVGGNVIFRSDEAEKMRIASGGNVGIGTTSPSYPLHVGTQVSNISIYAAYDIVAFSDQSVKENIRPIDNVIERIEKSRGIVYDRTDSGEKDNIGFIAQELEEQFPELVVENPDGTKAVKYQNAVAILFEAIKEQQKQINELRNGITD